MEAARIPEHRKQPKPYLVPFSPQESDIISPEMLQERLSAAMWPNKTPDQIADIHSRKAAKLERMKAAKKEYYTLQEALGRRVQITKDAAEAIGKIINLSLIDGTTIVGVCDGYTDTDPYHRTRPNLPYNKIVVHGPDIELPQEISTHDITSIQVSEENLPFVWEGDNN